MQQFFLLILATRYVTRLITRERGPFDVFKMFREAVLRYTRDDEHWLYAGVTCKICVGFWTSLILSLFLAGKSGQRHKALVALAVSEGVELTGIFDAVIKSLIRRYL